MLGKENKKVVSIVRKVMKVVSVVRKVMKVVTIIRKVMKVFIIQGVSKNCSHFVFCQFLSSL